MLQRLIIFWFFINNIFCLPTVNELKLTNNEITEENSRYLVSFNWNDNFEKFVEYDASRPKSQHILPYIDQLFKIGNYSGFAGNFSQKALERLKRCPLIAEVSPDIIVHAFDAVTQEDSPRHLARISQKNLLQNSSLYEYCYNDDWKDSVNAYVIDSGINLEHPQFNGRAFHGADFTSEGPGDFNGHGTHVAGLIGSESYGSSKNVMIYEVKALNRYGSGTLSSIISAIEFAVKHRQEADVPGVANLSLGSIRNRALNKAVDNAFKTGLIIVAAAGNSNTNACWTSPASAKRAITVGAIDDATDQMAYFSNWGNCVDINAPGMNINSVHFQSESTPATLSGTSMAAPIVAGQVANLLAAGVDYWDIKQTLKDGSSKNKIIGSSIVKNLYTPNRIVYNGMEGMC